MKKYTKLEINTIAFSQIDETSVEKSKVLVLKKLDALKFSNLND